MSLEIIQPPSISQPLLVLRNILMLGNDLNNIIPSPEKIKALEPWPFPTQTRPYSIEGADLPPQGDHEDKFSQLLEFSRSVIQACRQNSNILLALSNNSNNQAKIEYQESLNNSRNQEQLISKIIAKADIDSIHDNMDDSKTLESEKSQLVQELEEIISRFKVKIGTDINKLDQAVIRPFLWILKNLFFPSKYKTTVISSIADFSALEPGLKLKIIKFFEEEVIVTNLSKILLRSYNHGGWNLNILCPEEIGTNFFQFYENTKQNPDDSDQGFALTGLKKLNNFYLIGSLPWRIIFDSIKQGHAEDKNSSIQEIGQRSKEKLAYLKNQVLNWDIYNSQKKELEASFQILIVGVLTDLIRDYANEIDSVQDKDLATKQFLAKFLVFAEAVGLEINEGKN